MRKFYLLSFILVIVLIVSSCGIFNPGANGPKVRTNVNIIDPYGNKLFVDGTINGLPLKADKNGVHVEGKIEAIREVKLGEGIRDVFSMEPPELDKDVITIFLEKKADKFIRLYRTADGKVVFYAVGYGDTPSFQVWLKEPLAGSFFTELNPNQVLIAGNYLVGVGKGLGKPGLGISPNEIVVKLNIPATKVPQIIKFEEVK
ncbi:MAG: hypothetical protein WHS64_02100 [Fervidobacterium sp.]|uniref:Uncharacterized protein n=1 Tax=Fervidobacterium gondwanense DSM 13020 TaxID=1121883 RepID=A0A1M7RVP1_FERGO|nr:hypothetical protein [Fervidobacterium gondwanense]UXF01935.1 hypothetical protein IB67_10620 [Fervidobacterium riparium]SHN50168.1 hypothetical protein SAMN02745226_00209 [Fervidobacterium gondwanense DSM 13020]